MYSELGSKSKGKSRMIMAAVVAAGDNDTTDQVVIEETTELLSTSLVNLDAAIVSAGNDKAAWAPPSSLETGLGARLTFLRWAKFDAEKARVRRALYWEERFAIWPGGVITCAGDAQLQTALKLGISEVAPGARDAVGRQVVAVYLPRVDYTSGIGPRDVLRVFWYMQHAAYDDDAMDPEGLTKRKGIVVVNNLKGMAMANFKRETGKMILRSMQEVLPIRIGAMRIVHQPYFFNVVFSVMSVFMSKKFRERLVLHGADEASLFAHIPRGSISTLTGGENTWDHQAWVKERIAKEEAEAQAGAKRDSECSNAAAGS